MKSKNWPSGFVRGCAAISLLGISAAAQTPPAKTPAIALIDPTDAVQWQNLTREVGWQVIAPPVAANTDPDQRALALKSAVEAAISAGTTDPARVYLAARGDASPLVFYTISRVPDLWAAGVAIGGSPKFAVDTNRIFTANFTNVPVLWISGEEGREEANKLKDAKLNLEWKPVTQAAGAAVVIEWLAAHHR